MVDESFADPSVGFADDYCFGFLYFFVVDGIVEMVVEDASGVLIEFHPLSNDDEGGIVG